jgi:hypothetical protein
MENKTHYRKVFKSDHLGVADLEEFIEEKRSLIFTIKQVKQEFNVQVAGRKGNHNIAYFIDGIKPLVLNSTNSKTVKSFNNNSPFVEDWKLTKIELYIDYEVKMKGEKVGGVRIKLIQPKEKVKPEFNEKNFEPAHKAKASLETIKKSYSITEEVESKYLDYVAKNG